MVKRFFTLLFSLTLSFGYSQNFKILHYTETSGFDHQTRQNSLALFQAMGQQHGFTVDDDQTGAAFDSLNNLMQYAVVVFSNTSGNQILDSAQRANFEAYIQNGGSLLGIHAASDTYRHSTANGNNTGTWDAYAELLGGSVQQNPNHTSANHNGTMDIVSPHPTVAHIPDPWAKVEEYYYWENGYLNPNNQVVLEVRSTGANSYDARRPVSWYKEMFTASRLFYTSLGHANSNFTSDTAFYNHIRDAVLWAAHQNVSLPEIPRPQISLYPNPVRELLHITADNLSGQNAVLQIMDLAGQEVFSSTVHFKNGQTTIQISHLSNGTYILKITAEKVSTPKSILFSKE